eukprot:Rhum_TRINITY_DN4855_c0_g1::Rhum_TRINITY_DN4855_c0_g1_i1::g.15883::m.15883
MEPLGARRGFHQQREVDSVGHDFDGAVNLLRILEANLRGVLRNARHDFDACRVRQDERWDALLLQTRDDLRRVWRVLARQDKPTLACMSARLKVGDERKENVRAGRRGDVQLVRLAEMMHKLLDRRGNEHHVVDPHERLTLASDKLRLEQHFEVPHRRLRQHLVQRQSAQKRHAPPVLHDAPHVVRNLLLARLHLVQQHTGDLHALLVTHGLGERERVNSTADAASAHKNNSEAQLPRHRCVVQINDAADTCVPSPFDHHNVGVSAEVVVVLLDLGKVLRCAAGLGAAVDKMLRVPTRDQNRAHAVVRAFKLELLLEQDAVLVYLVPNMLHALCCNGVVLLRRLGDVVVNLNPALPNRLQEANLLPLCNQPRDKAQACCCFPCVLAGRHYHEALPSCPRHREDVLSMKYRYCSFY